MATEKRVSFNINFRSINPDRLREIVTFALLLDHKFSVYVDDEIKEYLEREDETVPEPVVYIKSELVEELKASVPDPKATDFSFDTSESKTGCSGYSATIKDHP